MVTRTLLLRVSALVAALASSGMALAAAEFERGRADVVAASSNRPLASARGVASEQAVAGALRGRGRDAATVSTLRTVETRTGRAGMSHVRLEQVVEGLPVYGAYARAAFDRSGGLVHLIDHLAAAPAGPLAPTRIDATQALRAAMARVHPGIAATFRPLSIERGTTLFDGGAFFLEAPRVTAVAVPLNDGSMARGWLVETWSKSKNLLHHVLVSGDGRVLDVERRTADDSYNVFPIDPGKAPQVVVSGPGAGNAQSPAGWLTGRSEKSTNIGGNNVNAYLDADANNRADAGGTRVTGGNFLAAANLTVTPTTTVNKAVAVQNLFYLNNVIHDILYSHGFDESAGNFQVDNFGKGGAGNDAVRAEAQDGSGTDNANFATPPDGRMPRMQMYLWSGAGPSHEVVITSPVNVTYGAKGAEFGAQLNTTGLSGSIAAAAPVDGCGTLPLTGVSGKIALVDRGSCDFTTKAANAQAGGAVGLIVANNTGGTAIQVMGGTNAAVTIPALMISQNDGTALRGISAPVGTIRAKAVQPLQIDASLDSDVVFHEYGHGLSWRMIGNMDGPLAGAIGEGASDGVAMLVNGDDRMGEYSSSSPSGIRRYPYTGYPLTYADVTGQEVHNDGEIYGAIVWRMIELFGSSRRGDLFTYYVDGMNFTPATPAYENMRDGILQAVATGGGATAAADTCIVWSAFAQFGVGVGASGVVHRNGTVTITPSFAKPPGC